MTIQTFFEWSTSQFASLSFVVCVAMRSLFIILENLEQFSAMENVDEWALLVRRQIRVFLESGQFELLNMFSTATPEAAATRLPQPQKLSLEEWQKIFKKRNKFTVNAPNFRKRTFMLQH